MSNNIIKSIVPNTNRIVSISRNSAEEGKSWRTLFSDILTEGSTESLFNATDKIVSSEFAKDLNVNENIELLMQSEPPEFSTSNEYDKALNSVVNTASSLLPKGMSAFLGKSSEVANVIASGLTSGISSFNNAGNSFGTGEKWAPWVTQVEAWSGVNNTVEFPYKFNFNMGQYGLWNAKEEVFKPILNLISANFPRFLSAATMSGPYPTATDLVAKALSGLLTKPAEEGGRPGLDVASDENALAKLGSSLETLVLDSYRNFTYTIKFGNMITFNKVMMKTNTYSFSSETDQYGYPIAGSVEINFRGIIPPALTTSNTETMAIRFGN